MDRDPEGIVEETHWVDPTGQTPALPEPIAPDEMGAVVLKTSQHGLIRIAVNGNGCVPETHLVAGGSVEALEIEVILSEAIPDPGLACADLLTTHAFEVLLSEAFRDATVHVVASGDSSDT